MIFSNIHPGARIQSDAHSLAVRRIVFSSTREGNEDIFMMNADGKDVRRCTYTLGAGRDSRLPEWSPDGNQIAFQSNRDGPREFYLLTLADSNVKRLTHTPNNGLNAHPAWSSDGKSIIFSSSRGNGFELYMIGADGSNERSIAPTGLRKKGYFNPCWTPDGGKIAFTTAGDRVLAGDLWVMELDGSNPRRISPNSLQVYEYDYSPDGQTIVFDVRHDSELAVGDWDIYIMSADGSGVRRLTDHSGVNSRPKWLSDGKTIVFHSNRYGDHVAEPERAASREEWLAWWNQFEICTMEADGSNVCRLTSNQFWDLHPDG